MRRFVPTSLALVLGLGAPSQSASAEDSFDLQVTPEVSIAQQPLTYEEYRVLELQRTALRSRNALIGTAAAAAVGLALTIPAAATQCQSIEVPGEDSKYECSRTGDTLLRVGSPLVIGGLTGAVVSGIILGVRKGKLRRLNESFPTTKQRAVRWDERRSRFVF